MYFVYFILIVVTPNVQIAETDGSTNCHRYKVSLAHVSHTLTDMY